MMAREHPRTDQPDHWQSQGACRTRPDLNWFPERGQNIGEQRDVCASCLVRIDCLAEALDLGAHADFGIWGGTSERQRRDMRRRRNKGQVIGL